MIRRHGLRLRFLRKIRHRKWQDKIDQVPDIKNTSLWDDFRWFYKFDFSISKKYFIRLFTARRAVTKTMWKIILSSENVKFTWKLNVTFVAPAPYDNLLFLKFLITPRLSGVEKLHATTLIFQNWSVSRLFTNIFYNLNFAEEHYW